MSCGIAVVMPQNKMASTRLAENARTESFAESIME